MPLFVDEDLEQIETLRKHAQSSQYASQRQYLQREAKVIADSAIINADSSLLLAAWGN
jgi:F0F1-type ATP synthase membrane subunit b/b'